MHDIYYITYVMTFQEILPKYTEILQENQRLQSEILQLKQQLAEMKRLIFGQKRERFIPSVSLNQLSFLADEQAGHPRRKHNTVIYYPANDGA
ncbi:MAG: transposase [Candidatus Marinimicrobia bacterium]|nr:transposase [Candidatus Neomarinimicrobiota bacterium]